MSFGSMESLMKCVNRWLWLVFSALASSAARAEFPTTQPYPEVRYVNQVVEDPPQQIHVVSIDLADPDVAIRVSPGGADPDGPGPWQTTLLVPSVVATRENFDVVVNGDFFSAKQVKDAEGKSSGYVTGIWASALGPAVTDGKTWARPDKPRPALVIDANGRPTIGEFKEVPSNAKQAVAGSTILLNGGKVVAESQSKFSTTRHPRTAVGIAEGGKRLVLVVVDGRRKGEASGMTLMELADLMSRLGCQSALNLDGGGSTELLLRDPETGALHVMNHPSDGRERAVANVLGITVRGTKRIATTQMVPAVTK
jgi:hypothetical protein